MEVTDSRHFSAGGRQRPGALAVRRPSAERPPSVRYTFADDALAATLPFLSSFGVRSSSLIRSRVPAHTFAFAHRFSCHSRKRSRRARLSLSSSCIQRETREIEGFIGNNIHASYNELLKPEQWLRCHSVAPSESSRCDYGWSRTKLVGHSNGRRGPV